jgi:hypothetical protein
MSVESFLEALVLWIAAGVNHPSQLHLFELELFL